MSERIGGLDEVAEATVNLVSAVHKQRLRTWVDTQLVAMEAVRDGVLNAHFIEGPHKLVIEVDPETVDEDEAHFRDVFSQIFPDLIEFPASE